MRLLLPVLFTCANAVLLENVKRLDDPATEITGNNGIENTSWNASGAGVAPVTSATTNSNSSVYIVVLKEDKEEAEYEEHDSWVLNQFSELRKRKREEGSPVPEEVEFFNVSSFHGYAGEIPEPLLNTIRENPLVDFVEQDSRSKAASITTQNDAPWGLARISRRQLRPVSNVYRYDTEGGKGVTAFVLDTGIQVTDPEFEGRARWGMSIDTPSSVTDRDGHGTHVAGIIGSKTYGVAKKVDLVAVKTSDEEGAYVSNSIKGIQYAVSEHRKLIEAKTARFKGSIINISFMNDLSRAFDTAVNAAVRAGVHVVVSAGNGGTDACNVSPARATGAITVGATDEKDQPALNSNYGRCVDIHAPGENIPSVSLISTPELSSGTSPAAPHVAGLLAYLLSLQPDKGSGFSGKTVLSPGVMRRMLFRLAVRGVVIDLPPNTPNVFAYNGAQNRLAQALDLVGPDSADSGGVPI